MSVTLHVESGNDALNRVVCVCRRRGLEILELSYANDQIRLTIAGRERQMRQIERWLAALVNVFHVDRNALPGLQSAVPPAETVAPAAPAAAPAATVAPAAPPAPPAAAPPAPPRAPHDILADAHYLLRHAEATAP